MRRRMNFIFYTSLFLMTALLIYTACCSFGLFERDIAAAAGNRTKTAELYRLRGTIYDQDLHPLTNGAALYHLMVDPRSFDRAKTESLGALCGIDMSELTEKLERETVFFLTSAQKPESMAGVRVFSGVQRYQHIATHLIGYIDSDSTGVSGLEKSYNRQLSYFGGGQTITYVSDAVRNPIVGLGVTVEGSNGSYRDGLVTTLDIGLQRALEQSMSAHIEKGAAVVLDAESGEIRALVSLPDFDPDRVSEYLNGSDGQLINRCLTDQTVGSVFKVVPAIAAIEQGLTDFTYECTGSITVNGRRFGCGREHGKVGLEDAFALSCNVYFIALGQMLGFEKCVEVAERLGFTERMEIADSLYAAAGNLPDAKSGVAQQLANFSIGQGEVMATPLQIARTFALCGNGGYLVHPTAMKGYYVSGRVTSEKWLRYRERVLDEETAETLRGLCVATVQSGTGQNAKPENGGAGGKTASAQTGLFDSDGVERLNTYFAGFYPAENPRYAIAVFAENGESGGSTCAPVFKEVCDRIFTAKKD